VGGRSTALLSRLYSLLLVRASSGDRRPNKKSGRQDLNLRPLRPERSGDRYKHQQIAGESVATAEPLHQWLHQANDLLHIAEALRVALDPDQRRRLAVELLRE